MSKTFSLINPENESVIFKLFPFAKDASFAEVQRLVSYSLILITEGDGKLITDILKEDFHKKTLLCFSPYQPFRIISENGLAGYSLTFHPDFLCVYKHHKEVACNGVLFDNTYHSPVFSLTREECEKLLSLITEMEKEMSENGLAKSEAVVSLLKLFLINATRISVNLYPETEKKVTDNLNEPVILSKLKEVIEEHFKTKHSAGEYADLLNISSKALAKLAKTHFNKTLTDMIADRILIEAKRELYLTSKSVKEIAYSLGFQDEYYFSRFFKNKVEVSPQVYRNTIGFAKAEML